ncbi:elongator complex protein 5 isoform X1 [Gopherus flavomarginatus]|uniref:elongator complex protein 5 isoform X1 n=1 Tax=Gopherus flavomarginatus TaxID=286002 RepID=UPI0021CC15A4|nr:elongator complex protein 5 isoform X1 [Gopherus flavomarginatus]
MLGELVAGATGGLVLIQDTAECEGHSLLKTFVAASAHRGESVHVFGFEIPEEEFLAGFDPDVTVRLLYQDGFTDPLHWTGEAGGFGAEEFTALGVTGRLARGPAGPATVVLDSLSWLLLRQPLPAVCQTLGQIPRAAASAGLRVTRILALLHEDLHPPGLVETLRSLARAVVGVRPAPEGMGSGEDAPRLASMLQRKGTGKVLTKEEYFTVLAGFTPKALGEPTGSVTRDEDADPHSTEVISVGGLDQWREDLLRTRRRGRPGRRGSGRRPGRVKTEWGVGGAPPAPKWTPGSVPPGGTFSRICDRARPRHHCVGSCPGAWLRAPAQGGVCGREWGQWAFDGVGICPVRRGG